MGSFNTIDIGATGAQLGSTWLDVLAHNMANLNTVRSGDEDPFRARLVVAQERLTGNRGNGVDVVQITEVQGDPPMVFQPDHPLANEDGYVMLPVVDLAAQMSDLILATRAYQANLSVIKSGREAYESALKIGRQ
jgi:flagellar basal-body rod protein FlgC